MTKTRQGRYCGNVTIHPMEVTSMGKEQPPKSFISGFIGSHSLKMHIHIVSIVKSAKRSEEYQRGMKCRFKASLRLKSLVVRG